MIINFMIQVIVHSDSDTVQHDYVIDLHNGSNNLSWVHKIQGGIPPIINVIILFVHDPFLFLWLPTPIP